MEDYEVLSPMTVEAHKLYTVWYVSSKSMGGKPKQFDDLSEVQQRAWKALAKKVKDDFESYKEQRMIFMKELDKQVTLYEENVKDLKERLSKYE